MKDLVVCKFAGCNQIYADPRILPCGKRTCAAHIAAMKVKNEDSNRKTIKCHFCEEMHNFPENGKGFLVDENIPLLLNMHFCTEHDAAKKSYNELTQLLAKLTKLDNKKYVTEYFEKVESEIRVEKEDNLKKLNAHYEKLIDGVQGRKVNCLRNLTSDITLERKLNAIAKTLHEYESKLKKENIDLLLKTLDGDEVRWKAIELACHTLLETTHSLGKELKDRIVGDYMIVFKPNTSNTQISNITGHLYAKYDARAVESTTKCTTSIAYRVNNKFDVMDYSFELCLFLFLGCIFVFVAIFVYNL